MAQNTLRASVELDDGGVTKKLNGISKAFDKIGGKGSGASFFGNVGAKAVAKGFDLVGASIGSVTGFLEDAVRAAAEDQASNERLRVALENNVTGHQELSQAILDYVDAQTARGFADDEVRDGLGQLVGVTHDVEDAQNLLTLAQDLARAKGIDLATATDIVTKAAQGNGKALKALGIDITGTSTAADILDRIQQNVKGSADAYNQTLEGKLNISQLKYNEAVENIGYQLMPVLADIMQKFADDWLPALGRGWNKVLTAIKPVADILRSVIGLIGRAIKGIQDFIAAAQKVPAVMPVLPGLPHFAEGGVVPGPINAPTLAVVHGGEKINPVGGFTGGGGTGVTIQGVSERDILDMVDRGLYFRLQRAAPTASRS